MTEDGDVALHTCAPAGMPAAECVLVEALAEAGFGDRAHVRRFEIAAALNRLRSLRVAPR